MGLFNSGKPESTASETRHVTSEATTVVPSQNVSDTDLEKHPQIASSLGDKSETGSQKKTDTDSTLQNQESSEGVEVQNEKDGADGVVASPEEDEMVYPGGLKLGLISLALCLSVFLVALDNTIIATAIPKITDHFDSLGDVGWYGSAYLLTTCALQLFFGK